MYDRTLHTVVVVAALILLGLRLVLADTVPVELWALVSTIVGAYFGAMVPGRAQLAPGEDPPRHAAPE